MLWNCHSDEAARNVLRSLRPALSYLERLETEARTCRDLASCRSIRVRRSPAVCRDLLASLPGGGLLSVLVLDRLLRRRVFENRPAPGGARFSGELQHRRES